LSDGAAALAGCFAITLAVRHRADRRSPHQHEPTAVECHPVRHKHGRKWRALPKRFGNWHTIYTRMSRWAKLGVLDRTFEQLQQAQIVQIKIEAVSLDSTSEKVHPDGSGAPKKTVRRLSASPVAGGAPRSTSSRQTRARP